MTMLGPLDFLRAAQFFRSADLDDFAEAVPDRQSAPEQGSAAWADERRRAARRSA